jgi:serine O-acetyltransferase
MNALEIPHVPDQEAESTADLPRGDTDENPDGIGFVDLLREDFHTHDKSLFEPGFWAIAVHRFGNWRMGIKPKLVRAPFSVAYRVASTSINWLWGIDLGYTVKLGRRVRIWHHGGMVLTARSIGDDVHIRHNTTMGLVRRSETTKRPTIESGVDIGVGACILGDVTVGHDSVVGANAVVVTSFPPHSRIAGVPARAIAKSRGKENGSGHPPSYHGK